MGTGQNCTKKLLHESKKKRKINLYKKPIDEVIKKKLLTEGNSDRKK